MCHLPITMSRYGGWGLAIVATFLRHSVIYVNVNRIKTEIFIESVSDNENKNGNYLRMETE